MKIADVMDQLGDALDTIPGLRVFPYYASRVEPPAAVVHWPDEYEFDQSFSRGADRIDMPVTVVVGKADARTARDLLAAYLDGAGTSSVKAAVESFVPAAPSAWDSVRVKSVEIGAVTIAAVSYLAATFEIEIVG